MRICQDCGQEIPDEFTASRKFCPDCVRRHKSESAKRRVAKCRIKKEMAELKQPVKTIAEIQREAQAVGMSYGQYVAMMRR